ncbi:MAG: hypothetical protein MUO40_07625 [Anaerolineaceae bacterium]|nr:hypothetical protein [Anaerolineaceae bacterium]
MSKNPIIPETWGIPDSQARKVIEALNKKSITPEDELQDALEDIARDIALIEPDPQDWGWWVTYLLEKLKAEANRRRRIDDYEKMINALLRNFGG